ncbi:MAG: sterol desaturase family protein, partial [Sphingomonadales bacterium]|nr:sterol desaturase family protein [Sphingomonadales bacterium]
MVKLPNPIDFAVPVFVLLILIEMIWAKRNAPEKYEPRDTLTSLAFGVGSTVAGALTAGLVVALFYGAYQYRLFDIGWMWWAWIVCFVVDDLAYYLFHRSAHRVRWFWASHVNHHSSQHYNLSTALRQSWTGFLALGFIFRLPLVLIGFDPAMVFFC